MDLTIAEAAALLGVHRSRVEQLLRSGRLAGRRSGRIWLVDGDAVADVQEQPRAAGRPMAPARAWALLDVLDGRDAPWLAPVARSQVRARLRGLGNADRDAWRALLRARSDVLEAWVHPAALPRLLADDSGAVLPAGPATAATVSDADLVALDALPEIYVEPRTWPKLAERWHVRPAPAAGNLRVRLPRGVWPFLLRREVGRAALAADLLDSPEPRAAAAGLTLLRELGGWNGPAA